MKTAYERLRALKKVSVGFREPSLTSNFLSPINGYSIHQWGQGSEFYHCDGQWWCSYCDSYNKIDLETCTSCGAPVELSPYPKAFPNGKRD